MRMFGWFVLFGMIINSGIAEASTGFLLEKSIWDYHWKEESNSYSNISLDSFGQWDWLELDLKTRIKLQQKEKELYSYGLKFSLPQLSDKLQYDLSYQGQGEDSLFKSGVEFNWKPFKGFKTRFDLNYTLDEGATGRESSLNEENLSLGYNKNPWEFKFKLYRSEKEYSKKINDNYLKYELREEFERKFKSLNLGLVYHEVIGDYPNDNGLRDYWKAEYIAYLKFRQYRNLSWDCEYHYYTKETGYYPYLDKQSLKWGLNWQKGKWNSSLEYFITDYDYFATGYVYSDEGLLVEEDAKNRREEKLSFQLKRSFEIFSFEIELFNGHKDFKLADKIDQTYTGLNLTLEWEFDKNAFQLDLSPWGTASNEAAVYSLKWEHNFKEGKSNDNVRSAPTPSTDND